MGTFLACTLRVEVTSIRTTAGVTASATLAKASLRSRAADGLLTDLGGRGHEQAWRTSGRSSPAPKPDTSPPRNPNAIVRMTRAFARNGSNMDVLPHTVNRSSMFNIGSGPSYPGSRREGPARVSRRGPRGPPGTAGTRLG